MRFYREALLHCGEASAPRLALAQLHLVRGETEQSEEECLTVLRAEPSHQGAGMVSGRGLWVGGVRVECDLSDLSLLPQLMADLLFRRGDYSRAAEYYQDLLGRKPGT